MHEENFNIDSFNQNDFDKPQSSGSTAQPQPPREDFGDYEQAMPNQQQDERLFRQKQLFDEKFHMQANPEQFNAEPPSFADFNNQSYNLPNVNSQQVAQTQQIPPQPTHVPQGQWVWENNNWVWKITPGQNSYAYHPQHYQPMQNQPAENPEEQIEQKPNSRVGLRVFCIMMAALLLLGGAAFGGYFILERDTGGGQTTTSHPHDGTTSGESSVVPIAVRPEGALTPAEVANRVKPSVVGITIYSINETTGSVAEGAASGIIINEEGLIVTNDHIYADFPSTRFLIITYDGRRYDADFVAGDVRSDVALLQIRASESSVFIPAEFGDSDAVVVGEEVIAIGTPLSITRAGSVTFGIVSATNRRERGGATAYTMNYIQTDAAINPGNSGGPLVNMQGQIIGINSWKLAAGAEGLGFSIPSRTAVSVLESLLENGYVAGRGRLGVSFTVITPLMSRINNIPEGLRVDTIAPESNLNNTDIEQGDIITHIEGIEVTIDTDFMSIIESVGAHNAINLTVQQRTTGNRFTANVVLLEDTGSSSFEE